MAIFESRPLANGSNFNSRLNGTLRKHPALFGVSFILIIVGASFGLQVLTQTRYDHETQRVTEVTKDEEVRLRKGAKRFDIREEYFKHASRRDIDWEPVRVPRPDRVADKK